MLRLVFETPGMQAKKEKQAQSLWLGSTELHVSPLLFGQSPSKHVHPGKHALVGVCLQSCPRSTVVVGPQIMAKESSSCYTFQVHSLEFSRSKAAFDIAR